MQEWLGRWAKETFTPYSGANLNIQQSSVAKRKRRHIPHCYNYPREISSLVWMLNLEHMKNLPVTPTFSSYKLSLKNKTE